MENNILTDMYSDFPETDQQKWLEKLEKELKRNNRKVEDLKFEVADGIMADPLLQERDRIETDAITSFPATCRSGVITDGSMKADVLRELLESGAQTLHIIGKADLITDKDFRKSTGKYHPDFIISASAKEISELKKTSASRSGDGNVYFLPLHQQILDLAECLEQKSLLAPLRTAINKSLESGILALRLGDAFLIQLAILRSIRIILQKKSVQDIKVAAYCSPTCDTKEGNLVAYTSQITSAIMGGADMVMLSDTRTDDIETVKRHLHIGNVLKLESKLDAVSDPAAGAYFIEHIAAQIVDRMQ